MAESTQGPDRHCIQPVAGALHAVRGPQCCLVKRAVLSCMFSCGSKAPPFSTQEEDEAGGAGGKGKGKGSKKRKADKGGRGEKKQRKQKATGTAALVDFGDDEDDEDDEDWQVCRAAPIWCRGHNKVETTAVAWVWLLRH